KHCPICLEEIEPTNPESSFSMSCQHFACKSCWTQTISTRLKEGILIQKCVSGDCNQILSDHHLTVLMDCEFLDRFRQQWLHSMMSKSKILIRCPQDDCNLILKLEDSAKYKSKRNIRCICGFSSWGDCYFK